MQQENRTTTNLYVALDGNDAWSGQLPEPNSARTDGPFATLARAQAVARGVKRSLGVTVTVRGGEYALTEPLAFTASDSGAADASVLYRAAEGETVRLTGGVHITGWRPVQDTATIARMHPDAPEHVLQADLAGHGVIDFGGPLCGSGSHASDPGLELFFRDQPMTLARYPNEGFLHIAALSFEDGHHIRGTRGSLVPRFRVDGERERLRRWAAEPDAMLHGYWFWDWADQRIAVHRIEPDTGEITLDETNSHHYGFRAGQWFYGFNLLCELDRPGEWYLDRQAGILYFWPPANMVDEDVTVSVLRDPVTLENTSHITLRGFVLEAVRGTAIQVTGGEAVQIAGCTIRNVGGDAVRVTGGSRHTVSDSDIYQTGGGGIHLDGGDRRTLTPGGHAAVNNHIHHIARWQPLYRVGIQLRGCGNRAARNRLHDLPHIAIGFTGNDQTVEFNEIYQSVTGANDAGAIYTSGAHPEDWSMRGHRVRFNYLHHLFGIGGKGCSGIYLDDMFSGTEIHGNVLWRVSLGFLLGGGRDIIAANNVFVDCPKAISLDSRALGWAAFSMPEVIAGLESMPYREEPWASRYPELVNILDDEPARPKGNVIVRNIVRRGDGIRIEDGARPGLRRENNLEQGDPRFVDEDKADWRLREDSPAIALGFEPLPVERIGLQLSPLRGRRSPRRLFEAEVVVETLPALRNGRPRRLGSIRLRLRNIGDAADSATIQLRACGGQLEDGDPFACLLDTLATAKKRFTLWPEAAVVHLEVVQHGVAGVLDACTIEVPDEVITPWPDTLSVSVPQPGAGRLEALDRVPPADVLQWQSHPVACASGFCNLHAILERMAEDDAVVWIGCRVSCREAMRVALLLGYDGPVKLFVDGQPVFHDPAGTTPARPDSATPDVRLAAGEHRVAIALGADRGRAWGIYLRLRRVDCAAEGTVTLPEIHGTYCK